MARVKLSSLAGGTVEDVPGQSAFTLVRLRPTQVAPTPLNPRKNFGTTEDLAELGESLRVRQLQPVVVVSRAAYLKLWPDHEDQVGAAEYVLANGERRYRSTVQVGLEGIDAILREEIAESRESFIDAVVSENIDRRNFDLVEEAMAVESMVRECGSARAAAERFRRGEAWVSQRRALLKLSPELQEQVRAGALPVRIARSIASLPHEEQEAAWLKARTPQPEAPQPPTGEQADDAATSAEVQRGVFTAVKNPRGSVPTSGNRVKSEAVPWESPPALADLIRKNVTPENMRALVALLDSDVGAKS